MTNSEKITIIEFPCSYSTEQKYEMASSGEYGVFVNYNDAGEPIGFRGHRTGYGVTGRYDNYRAALEASFIEFGNKSND